MADVANFCVGFYIRAGSILSKRGKGSARLTLEAEGKFMDLVGSGKRLSSAELLTAADKLGVDVATLRAILQVETAGAGFDAKKRLKLLFEPHIFYRQLGPGPKRDEAVKKGLAYRKARTRPYP